MASRVYVGGLDERISERDLDDEFGRFGKLRNIWIARKPPGFAFIEYEDDRDAQDAVKKLDGQKGWRVEFSRKSDRGPPPRGGGGSGGGRGDGGGGGRGEMRCYECGEVGHLARDCRGKSDRHGGGSGGYGGGGGGSSRGRSPPRGGGRSRSPEYRRRSSSVAAA
ncbi:MAG: hypothetical protein WDW36_005005 [Sanguina aurantia]